MAGFTAVLALKVSLALGAMWGMTSHLQHLVGVLLPFVADATHSAIVRHPHLELLAHHSIDSFVYHTGNLTAKHGLGDMTEKMFGRRLQFGACTNATALAVAKAQALADGNTTGACNLCVNGPQNVTVSNSSCFATSYYSQATCSCAWSCGMCVKRVQVADYGDDGGDYDTVYSPPILDILVWTLHDVIAVIVNLSVALCMWSGIQQAGQLETIPTISTHDFESSLCECCNECNSCCTGSCCPVVRAAQTLHMAKVVHFWQAMLIYSLALFLPVLGWFLFAIARFVYRMRLRAQAGLPSQCACDFFAVFLCPGCTICQEARHMDKAMAMARSPGPSVTHGIGAPSSGVPGPAVGMVVMGQPVKVNQT